MLSSQIEGTQSSLQDLLAAEAQITDDHQPLDDLHLLAVSARTKLIHIGINHLTSH